MTAGFKRHRGAASIDEAVDRYLDRHPEASVAQLLGRFLLDPEKHSETIADRLGDETPNSDSAGAGSLKEVSS